MLAALRLGQLILVGGLAGAVVVMWSFSNWRAAVKVAFVVALFEGAIRKWLLPGGQELVYFLKDVFLFGAYLKFFFSPDPELRAWRVNIPGTLIVVLSFALVPAALNFNIGSALLAVYGLKIYLFYIPLLFMMPYLFRTKHEMIRQLAWYALIAIPICLLGLAQWRAGASSPLNVYAQQDLMQDTNVSGFGFGEKVRITGTFSYITGHMTFVIFFSSLAVALLAVQETRWKWLLLWVCLPLLAGNAMMNGSRAVMYVIGLVLVGFTVASVSGKLGTSKNFTAMLVAGFLVCMAAGAYFFFDAYANYSTRARASGDSLYFRTVEHPLSAIENALVAGGMTGYGIGTTHPATEGIRRALKIPAPHDKPPVYDMEVGQILVEVGVFATLAWYALRIVILLAVWKAYFACQNLWLKPIVLMAALLNLPYLQMGVVYNHTSNLLLFGVTGLAFAAQLEPTVKRRFVRGGRSAGVVQPSLPNLAGMRGK